ncbi:MAG: biopolymer transporter ExbD [Planctomycetes bacterium]|nr:biopolymer transporter ExbD [Planctomycetota bacterium]
MKTQGAKAVHYESGPNMTPLVDVVMVILIFLMLAGTFGGQEHYLVSSAPISGNGPSGEMANVVNVDEPIRITVDNATGDHFIARADRMTASDGPTLTAALTKLRHDMISAGKHSSDLQIQIAPGHAVKYEHVMAVQEAAMSAQFEKIGFVTAH